MKTEHIDTIVDSFTDYAGNKHYFVIAAISIDLVKSGPYTAVYAGNIENPVAPLNQVANIQKEVHIGIAICSPEDEFNEYIGAEKAIKRAHESPAIMYVTQKGYINTKLIKALLEQEANYLKDNPGKYIKGYSASNEKYLKDKKMEEIGNNLTDLEQVIVNKLIDDSTYLDKMKEYVKWLKCKK